MKLSDSPPTLPAFGARLRQMRRAAGMKQFALADLLGIDQSTVSRWEAGSQCPDRELQERAFAIAGARFADDFALRRLVETSSGVTHLIEDATHKCLAVSKRRAAEWGSSIDAMNGRTLWPFATEEIQAAEDRLNDSGWWTQRLPEPRCFLTSAKNCRELSIRAGKVLWERLYLADGTPVRLCTSLR